MVSRETKTLLLRSQPLSLFVRPLFHSRLKMSTVKRLIVTCSDQASYDTQLNSVFDILIIVFRGRPNFASVSVSAPNVDKWALLATFGFG